MSFFKSLFSKKEQPIHSYADFWNWFQQHEKKFFKVLKNQDDIHTLFFEKLSPKLNELREGFWFLAGMYADTTAELILTADGVTKNIVFVEELVAAAPKINNWKITALKQPSDVSKLGVNIDGYKFDATSLHFYAINHPEMPDEIDIIITHDKYNEENRTSMLNGMYIALDVFLGELKTVTTIDNLDIINTIDATEELIPFEKLKDFLIWREKEFIEKYQGTRHNTKNDNYAAMEGTLQNGLPLLAIINAELLHWDSKASHPWIVHVELNYDRANNNGLPTDDDYELLSEIEDNIVAQLKDAEGYLNIGRQTADSVREVYFACIDFRKPSKVLDKIKKTYQDKIKIDFEIYKDKYWQSFHRFMHE
ncbi:DUF695 domain-containing protein [Kordia sp.]|uniref:DUF695 domain-containing protein n=1 Tax=Kordia sp. TaxID=1965332 RepID=UPI003D2D5B1E